MQGPARPLCTWFFISVLIAGCSNPDGVSFEKNLYTDDAGMVRWRKDGSLFSGETFELTCPECVEPLFNHWPVHFIGNYKDGVRHGTFWLPKSGHSDHFFYYSEREDQLIVEFREGKRLSGE